MTQHWQYAARDTTGNGWDDEEIEVTEHDAVVRIAVTDSHAIGSYNEMFTCGITLPLPKVVELRDMLNGIIDLYDPSQPSRT